ncbi:unnamed protein product [Spirodela intermedia]|uniref:BHLH domain-containing protein n=1 Tax=Spirodela intermedia TaxID=51605 RepID=A0A7I8JTY9_SPIIN|nr:unnamed protein product [Spirodela intermedia]CAA6673559.1 unnamed protein product [Spirodela intermedia]
MLLEEQDQRAAPPEPGAFQLLLRLQEERLRRPPVYHPPPPPPPWGGEEWPPEAEPWCRELDSCVTHTSESMSKQEPSGAAAAAAKTVATGGAAVLGKREGPAAAKRKRKRLRRTARNVEEVESQRMTHIAVERNRRRLMNDHLTSLRSLMPPSFVQRGDQASIVGGAIDFVKELEQLLQSLQAEKQRRSRWSGGGGGGGASTAPFRDFFASPQYTTYTSPFPAATSPASLSSSASSPFGASKAEEEEPAEGCYGGGVAAGGRRTTAVADVEATVVQAHVNLRVLTQRRPAQLLRAVAALEELHLTVLHLNVTSLDDSVFYCFNLKMEEQCALCSADQIAAAAHQIFSFINSSC